MTTEPASLIDPQERRRTWWIIGLALLAVTLPSLWALAITPNGYTYGGLLYNPDDQNVHLAWARQAAQGHVFFRDLFTTESLETGEHPLFTNLFCLGMGWISALTHVPLIWVYHALRLLFTALALHWFYFLCTHLTTDKRIRLLALVLAAFSLGGGWMRDVIPSLAGYTFIDRPDNAGFPMMPEAFTFSSAFIFPLNIASLALLVFIYGKVLAARETGYLRGALWAGGAAFLLSNIHTYDIIPLNITLLLWIIIGFGRGKNRLHHWLTPLGVILGTVPPFLYQWWVFKNSSEFSTKASTPTPAPPVNDVLISYGLLFVLALLGLVVAKRHTSKLLPGLWAAVTLAAIYAPVSFARKMIEGLHLPLGFLAATGLVWLVSRLPQPALRRPIATAATLLLCASTFQFVNWCLWNAQDNNRSREAVLMPPLYVSSDDWAALQWLNRQPQPDDEPPVVLCLNFLGNYVPRETGMYTYIGHWAETLSMPVKLGEVMSYFRGSMPSSYMPQWLRAYHIRYVIEGSYEHRFSDNLPSFRLGLKPVFQKGGTTVYEVPAG